MRSVSVESVKWRWLSIIGLGSLGVILLANRADTCDIAPWSRLRQQV
jgi:hypothetical protein